MRISMSVLAAIAGAVTAVGSANASMPIARPAATYQPPALTRVGSVDKVPWHYEWQYHYDRHGEWVPGWVAVLNNIR